jgi:hypothetical protein
MVTRKSIASSILCFLVVLLLLSGCSMLSGGETPTVVAPPPPTQAPPTATTAPPTVTPEPTTEPAIQEYKVVDTGQSYCYDAAISIPCPEMGGAYFGQDAQYAGNPPAYSDNGDGTVTDANTGLMWVKDPGVKMTYDQAVAGTAAFNLGGYSDWRLPTIHELYSLVHFSGIDPGDCASADACPDLLPFIDTAYFTFQYGQAEEGDPWSDAAYLSSTPYAGSGGLVFGVNFADGRVKGYPAQDKTYFVRYVRGAQGYGAAQLVDNGDGTLSDPASGLTWMQTDSQQALAWSDALAYCENLAWGGFEDWRLPNAKELYSIVDTSRAPDVSNTAAANSLFQSTPITNEAGQPDYAHYWTSTTHLDRQLVASEAVYVAFGRALGFVDGAWTDIHGAGAQRSDPKTGDPAAYPQGRGPQGETVRILNYARCVRGGVAPDILTGGEVDPNHTTPPVAAQPAAQVTPPPASNQPPPEAFAACEGKQANTACTYEWIFGKQDGVCNDIFGQLVCMPGVVLPTLP